MSLCSPSRILMARFLKQASPKLAQKEQTIVNYSNSVIEMHSRAVLRRGNVHATWPRGYGKPLSQ